MRSGDLIAVLCDLGDMPMEINCHNQKVFVQKIETIEGENPKIVIDLGVIGVCPNAKEATS